VKLGVGENGRQREWRKGLSEPRPTPFSLNYREREIVEPISAQSPRWGSNERRKKSRERTHRALEAHYTQNKKTPIWKIWLKSGPQSLLQRTFSDAASLPAAEEILAHRPGRGASRRRWQPTWLPLMMRISCLRMSSADWRSTSRVSRTHQFLTFLLFDFRETSQWQGAAISATCGAKQPGQQSLMPCRVAALFLPRTLEEKALIVEDIAIVSLYDPSPIHS